PLNPVVRRLAGVALAQAEAVADFRVDVQLRRDAGRPQRQVVVRQEHREVVAVADGDERRRHVFTDGRPADAPRPGVDQGLEVRAATLAFHGVVGALFTGVELVADQGRHLAAGREAHHAHAARVDAPLLRPTADQADGPLAVLEGVLVNLVRRAG